MKQFIHFMQTHTRNYKNYSYQTGDRLPVRRSKKRRLGKFILVIAVILIIFFIIKGVLVSGNGNSDSAKGSSSATEENKKEPEKPKKKVVDTSDLKASLEQISKQYPYNTGVAVIDLNSGTLVQSGDDYPYVAASTTKLLTAVLYLEDVEQGKVSLSKNIGGKTAQEQLRLMINRSDNPAWHQINTYLSIASLQAFATEQGLTSYDARKNTMTTKDMAILLAKIHNREILNDQHTELLYSWMQNTSEERFIPAAVPAGVKMYHKAGYLNDRVHDVAIVDNGTAPFVIVIYSKSYNNTAYSYLTGQKLFNQITAHVLNTFSK